MSLKQLIKLGVVVVSLVVMTTFLGIIPTASSATLQPAESINGCDPLDSYTLCMNNCGDERYWCENGGPYGCSKISDVGDRKACMKKCRKEYNECTFKCGNS